MCRSAAAALFMYDELLYGCSVWFKYYFGFGMLGISLQAAVFIYVDLARVIK